MKLDSLEKLYVHELKDLHSAERQMLDSLPKMEAAASNDDLKRAFSEHRKETQTHVKRLEKVFLGHEFAPSGHKCRAMEGIIGECEEMIEADADKYVRDAGLVACAQRAEHYEIAAYGTAVALAEELGRQEEADVLRETLEEEGKADRDLSVLAVRLLNFKALAASAG